VADIGSIVTDEEVSSFITGWSQPGEFTKAEQALVKGVESEVEQETGRTFSVTTYTDEEYSIGPPVINAGIIVRETIAFRLNQYPVTTFTSLKKVTARDASTGLASATETLQRNSYHVEMSSGIVRMISPDLLNAFDVWPDSGFPHGTKILLATYTAGTVPDWLKLLVLRVIARLSIQQKNNRWGRTSESVDGLNNEYPDVDFTKGEMRTLMRAKKRVFGRS